MSNQTKPKLNFCYSFPGITLYPGDCSFIFTEDPQAGGKSTPTGIAFKKLSPSGATVEAVANLIDPQDSKKIVIKANKPAWTQAEINQLAWISQVYYPEVIEVEYKNI